MAYLALRLTPLANGRRRHVDRGRNGHSAHSRPAREDIRNRVAQVQHARIRRRHFKHRPQPVRSFELERGIIFFKSLYIPDAVSLANLTAVNAFVGDDLTANYWTLPAQTTQFDGTAFQIGWNLLGYNWATAVQTGTVDPSKLDSYKVTFTTTGPLTNIRLDNIVASLGRMFEMKYYSKYGIILTSGAWANLTESDDDEIVFDEDSINILLHEGLINVAQQLEGEDMAADVTYANRVLHGDPTAVDVSGRVGLYAQYRKAYPSQSKKPVGRWSGGPRFRN